jgi:hypothetical protein
VARLSLIACSDDYLLEEALARAVQTAAAEFGGIEAEFLPAEITPDQLATEICSPSLFSPQRVLVVPEVGSWLVASPRPKKKKSPARKNRDADDPQRDAGHSGGEAVVAPLVAVLEAGIADTLAVVMGGLCTTKPGGTLVQVIEEQGSFEWIPVPEPPKPWEDVVVSEAQAKVLREVLARAADGVPFESAAERLLFDRLGFAPRLLAQEGRKLARAAANTSVDEDLVRALCFPRERSLEVVRDAVFERRKAPLLDLLAAAEAGIPVHDWRGRMLDEKGVAPVLCAQLGSLFQQIFYLRRLAAASDLEGEISIDSCGRRGWYAGRFRKDIEPRLRQLIEKDAPSPFLREGGRGPSPWNLGKMFAGAARYTDHELMALVSGFAETEAAQRGDLAMEALSSWLASIDW